MEQLNFQQLKELIELATATSTVTYALLISPTLISILALLLNYVIFRRHSNQYTTERIIEKEVEKLYQAVDCFFEYADTANLFFSMQEKNLENRAEGKEKYSSDGFKEKLKKATEDFHEKIHQIQKAIFLLQALGENQISTQIKTYREKTITLRKSIFEILQELETKCNPAKAEQFRNTLLTEKSQLEKLKDDCLNEIAHSKLITRSK